jgi:hypothetical protein
MGSHEFIRYIPFSNPHFQLVAQLSLLVHQYRNHLPMNTTLSELPTTESIPSLPFNLNPALPAEHQTPASHRKQRQVGPSKFVNIPPDPLYYFEYGLRKVYPYYFTFNTFCKERWRGKKLLDIFVTEFRDRPEEYYVWPFPSFMR